MPLAMPDWIHIYRLNTINTYVCIHQLVTADVTASVIRYADKLVMHGSDLGDLSVPCHVVLFTVQAYFLSEHTCAMIVFQNDFVS